MRKTLINQEAAGEKKQAQHWIDLERVARVEMTSENPDFPIEAALGEAGNTGWKAANSGRQTIRFLFDQPHRLRQIHLQFDETARPRTQEFVLRFRREGEVNDREILRQQFNFSLPGTTREIENYVVDLDRVEAFEISVIPDTGGGDAAASLTLLHLS